MSEIESLWQIPSIAHFCNLFRNRLDLPDFDYEVFVHFFSHLIQCLIPFNNQLLQSITEIGLRVCLFIEYIAKRFRIWLHSE